MNRFSMQQAGAALCDVRSFMFAAVVLLSHPLAAQSTTGASEQRRVVSSRLPQRTALPMTLDQPLVCPAGRLRAEQPVAHDRVVPVATLTTARFDVEPLPLGALVSGRVTWRVRPTSAPNYSAGRFNIAAQPPANSAIPGLQQSVQIHNIGSVPASAAYTSLRPGPWDVVAVPSAVLVAADLQPGVIAAFNSMRDALSNAGSAATAVFQSQIGSAAQTSYAILETCHFPGPVPATTNVRRPL